MLLAFGGGWGNEVQGVSHVILFLSAYSVLFLQENIADQIRQIMEIENLEEVFFY